MIIFKYVAIAALIFLSTPTLPASNSTPPEPSSNGTPRSPLKVCGKSVSWLATDVQKYPPAVKTYQNTWELISESPLRIKYSINGEDSTFGRSIDAFIAESERALQQDRDNPNCSQIQFCRDDAAGQEKTLIWLRCIASNVVSETVAYSRTPSDRGREAKVKRPSTESIRSVKEGEKTSAIKQSKGQSNEFAETEPNQTKNSSISKTKRHSSDATHCVEIVPKGFKCDGPYDRFLTNICVGTISIWWRFGSDPWGYQVLDSKGCTPVSAFKDDRSIDYKACSWDSSAPHGPLSDPCRYE